MPLRVSPCAQGHMQGARKCARPNIRARAYATDSRSHMRARAYANGSQAANGSALAPPPRRRGFRPGTLRRNFYGGFEGTRIIRYPSASATRIRHQPPAVRYPPPASSRMRNPCMCAYPDSLARIHQCRLFARLAAADAPPGVARYNPTRRPATAPRRAASGYVSK